MTRVAARPLLASMLLGLTAGCLFASILAAVVLGAHHSVASPAEMARWHGHGFDGVALMIGGIMLTAAVGLGLLGNALRRKEDLA